MKWIGKRISFEDEKNKTTIVIYPEDIAWMKGVIGAWVAMWYSIGAIVVWSYYTFELRQQENVIILYLFICKSTNNYFNFTS